MGVNPGYLIGGAPNNFEQSARISDSPFFVVEADEYDTSFFDRRSKFLHYRPKTLVLNNLEFDHADIFVDLEQIKQQFHLLLRTVPKHGLIIYPETDRNLQNWLFFAGFGGSFFAFINTNLEDGAMVYTFIHYFIAHGLILIVVAALIIDGYRPSWKDYFSTVKWTTFLVIIMIIINILLDSNYMFTQSKPPGVTFTKLMPEWPYYFLIMLLIGLISYTLMMLVKFIPKKN